MLPNPLGSSRLYGADTPSPLDSIAHHLEEHDFKFIRDEESQTIQFGIAGENGQFIFTAEILTGCTLRISAGFPVMVPESKRHLVSEFLQRGGFGMNLARLALDFDDGKCLCSVGAPFALGVLDSEVIQTCLSVCIIVADTFYPFLLKIIYSDMSPARGAYEALEALTAGE